MVVRRCLCILAALIFTGSCSAEPAQQAPDRALLVAAAIDRFGAEYPVPDVEVVQILKQDDLVAVSEAMSVPVRLVHMASGQSAHWSVNSVQARDGYWEVTMSYEADTDFFQGSLFFVVGDDGYQATTPEQVGATPTTSVS